MLQLNVPIHATHREPDTGREPTMGTENSRATTAKWDCAHELTCKITATQAQSEMPRQRTINK